MKWLIIVAVKIEKLMSTHATRLAIRANEVANKTLLSAILNSKDCTLVYDVVDFINIRQTSIRIQQTQTKKNPLESGFKNMWFWRADSLDGPVDGRSSHMKKYADSKEYGFVWTEA